VIPTPTHDVGIEHTAARFLPPSAWLSRARANKIILFPPQFFLLYLIAPFLSPENTSTTLGTEELEQQRMLLNSFIKAGEPPWGKKVISPQAVGKRKKDGQGVLTLDYTGHELEGSDRKGDSERVVLVSFKKEGPRDVEVMLRSDLEAETGQPKL